MRRNPDDPFDDLFRQLETFMEDMMHQGGVAGGAGPMGSDTHIDVHEYDDRITVIADLPGVEKRDIDLSSDGKMLSIRAENGDRHYAERIQLPGAVDPTSASATYNNGVLEVRFDRAGDSASIDVE